MVVPKRPFTAAIWLLPCILLMTRADAAVSPSALRSAIKRTCAAKPDTFRVRASLAHRILGGRPRTVKGTLVFVRSGPRWRLEITEADRADRRMARAYDGRVTRVLRSHLDTLGREYQGEVHLGSVGWSSEEARLIPQRAAYEFFDTPLYEFRFVANEDAAARDGFFVGYRHIYSLALASKQTGSPAGFPSAVRFEVLPAVRRSGLQIGSVWLDLSRGGMIVKSEMRTSAGGLIWRRVVASAMLKGAFWLPSKMSVSRYMSNGKKQWLRDEYVATVTSFDSSAKPAESEFTIKFPRGTRVRDYVRMRVEAGLKPLKQELQGLNIEKRLFPDDND